MQQEPTIAFYNQYTYPGKSIVIDARTPFLSDIAAEAVGYQWKIFSQDGMEILNNVGRKTLQWVPDASGVFTVEFTLTYGEEEVSIREELVVLDSPDTSLSKDEHLNNAIENLPGTWIGRIQAPWGSPYLIQVEFSEDGTYKAETLSTSYHITSEYRSLNSAFYYGQNVDSPLQTYELTDTLTNGDITGTLVVTDDFANQKRLGIQALKFSTDFNKLFFELWNSEHGPILLSLDRMIKDDTDVYAF